MATQVTLTVPDTTYQQAKELAQMTSRNVEEVLTEPILIFIAQLIILQPPCYP